MIKLALVPIFLLCFLLVYTAYTFYEAPFTKHFCNLYHKESKNEYANLIRILNDRDYCPSSKNDIFDKYIHWNNETIAAIKGNILVFKGSDTMKDLFYDFTTSPNALHKGRTISNIQLIYSNIKHEIKSIISLHRINIITGWSLGSVLSCITAFDNAENIDKIVCFGFPNIFDVDFKERYNRVLGNKTIIHNHNLDIFANMIGYGKILDQVDTTRWINVPISNIYKLLTNGLAFYHMSYFN